MAYQFEIIGIIFAFLMVYLTFVQFKRRVIGKTAFAFWTLFWFLGILLIIFHYQVSALLPSLNLVRALDLYMILSFIFLFAVIFYLYIRVNKTSKRFEDLARFVTMKKAKEERT